MSQIAEAILERPWEEAGGHSPDQQHPIGGLLIVLLMIIGALLTSLTLAREWEMGTMEQLLSTPLRPVEQLMQCNWELHCPVCGSVMRPVLTDETRVNPHNQYAMSKYTQEMIALNLGRRYNIPSAAMRFSIVQGPRQSFYNNYSGACRIFSLSYFFDRAPLIYEDGMQVRDYVNIHDVVRALLLVLEDSRADYRQFNVGGGVPYISVVSEYVMSSTRPCSAITPAAATSGSTMWRSFATTVATPRKWPGR